MTKLLLCTVFLLGFQTVRAEDRPKADATQTAQSADKSFFDTRTLEDFQRLVTFDMQEVSADQAPTAGG